MSDLSDRLEAFRAEVGFSPPPAAPVRRRGERRRNRHRALAAGATVLAVGIAMAVPLTWTDARDDSAPDIAREPQTLTGTIPAAFPLLTDLPLGGVPRGQRHGPSDEPVSSFADPWWDRVEGLPEPVDVLHGNWAHPGGVVDRTLMTFDGAETAESYVAAVSDAFESLPGREDLRGVAEIRSVLEGAAVSLVTRFEQGGSPAPGYEVVQLTRSGSAVLRVVAADDGGDPLPAAQVQATVDELSRASAAVVSAMQHRWTGFGDEDGVFVASSAEVADRLPAAPAHFQAFVGDLADHHAARAAANCPDARGGVAVHYLVDESWAHGAVQECGGYIAIWSRTSGGWQESLGTQDMWRCEDLERAGVPQGIVGDCYRE